MTGRPPGRSGVSSWRRFTDATPARIDLGRVGDALPTRHLLDFQHAHACARDAVHATPDFETLAMQLRPMRSLRVRSQAPDRSTYLRRPDLGRRLEAASAKLLEPGPHDAVFVVGDGLSAGAVNRHAAPLIAALRERLDGWRLGPVILAEQARVALGDEIGEHLGAMMVVVLIGERPGLTVANSLGVYVTHAPRVGRRDSERNCVSNIHAAGLSYAAAAGKVAWLMTQARALKLTGVALKEDADPKGLDRDAAALPCSEPMQTPGDADDQEL